jgi:hypothetical protein
MASPALAGPAGTGLTFTEEVAKNLQKRAARVAPTTASLSKPDLCRRPRERRPDTRRAS